MKRPRHPVTHTFYHWIFMKRLLHLGSLIILSCVLSGCLVLPLKQSDSDRSLYWCPPLINCASTEASTFVHKIEPFKLNMEFEQAWPMIKNSIKQLQGTNIELDYKGYLYAKSRSEIMGFVDYIEVLYIPEHHQLNVRSSSLLGIWDMGVNKKRTDHLRLMLKEQGVIE